MEVSSQSLSDQHQHKVTTCECCATHHQYSTCMNVVLPVPAMPRHITHVGLPAKLVSKDS